MYLSMFVGGVFFFLNAEQAKCGCCCGLLLARQLWQYLSSAPPCMPAAGPRHGPCLLPPSCSEECASLPRNGPAVSQIKKKLKNQGNFRPHVHFGAASAPCACESPSMKSKREIKKSQHALPRGEVVLMQGHGDASLPAAQLGQNVGLQGCGDARIWGCVAFQAEKPLLSCRFACYPCQAQLRPSAEACGSSAARPPPPPRPWLQAAR